MTNHDNLQGNPFAEMAEDCVDALAAERHSESPRKAEMAFLLGHLQTNAALAAAWETRQLRLTLDADRTKAPAEEEEAAMLADLTRPQSDAATPAKDLNPGDIVLIPMVVQPEGEKSVEDTVKLRPMDHRLVLEQDRAWVFRNLASPVMFQRTVKGPAR